MDTKDSISSYQIKSVSEMIQIPYISFYPNEKNFVTKENHKFSISTNPAWAYMTKAFVDLILFVKWTKFIFLYEDLNSKILRIEHSVYR